MALILILIRDLNALQAPHELAIAEILILKIPMLLLLMPVVLQILLLKVPLIVLAY